MSYRKCLIYILLLFYLLAQGYFHTVRTYTNKLTLLNAFQKAVKILDPLPSSGLSYIYAFSSIYYKLLIHAMYQLKIVYMDLWFY